MTDRILLDYIRQIYTLESEQYALTQILDTLKRELIQKRNMKQSENVNYTYTSEKEPPVGGAIVKICIGSIIILYGFIILIYGSLIGGLFCFIIGISLIVSGKGTFNKKSEIAAKNEKEKREVWKKNKEESNRILSQNLRVEMLCDELEDAIKNLKHHLMNKQKALAYMYSYDIIHESYRNLYGISKIYHLLDTGICDSLKGVNGAYSQMRMEQIIDNQQISINLQSSILKTNQMMYAAIRKTNGLVDTVNQMYLVNLNNDQEIPNIENNQEISNFLTRSSNNDMRAFKPSSEYLALAERQKRM